MVVKIDETYFKLCLMAFMPLLPLSSTNRKRSSLSLIFILQLKSDCFAFSNLQELPKIGYIAEKKRACLFYCFNWMAYYMFVISSIAFYVKEPLFIHG